MEESTRTGASFCQSDNTFSVDLNLSSLTIDPLTLRARYGSEVVTYSLPNVITPLSLDSPSILNLSTAATYLVTGSCDPSLQPSMGLVTVSIGSPSVSATSDCDGTLRTFSVDFDASEVSSEMALIQVEYGGQSVTAKVVNEIIRLRVDSPEPLSGLNTTVYTLTGQCNSLLVGNVMATLVETGAVGDSSCSSVDDTFSLDLDASNVTTNPFLIQVSHLGQSLDVEVFNELIPLSVDREVLSVLNLSTASSYVVMGDCDSSHSTDVDLTATEKDPTDSNVTGSSVAGSSICVGDAFSVTMDLSGMTLGEVHIVATHESHSSTARVVNHIVPLHLDTLTDFNLSTISSYVVSGSCDPSVGGNVVVTLVEDASILDEVSCDELLSRFTATLDSSGVDLSAFTDLTVQAEYGGESVTQSITNGVVPLAITSSGALDNSNKSAYRVAGDCDSSLGDVGVVVGAPNTEEQLVPCDVSSQSFSVDIDTSEVREDPATITVTQGSELDSVTDSATVENTISFSITLNPLPSLVESNKAAYLVSGFCDTSQNNRLSLQVHNGENSSDPMLVDKDIDCTNNRFSELLDLSDITAKRFMVLVYKDADDEIHYVTNELLVDVSLSSSLPQINDGNRMAYPISGVCDSSESSIVTVTFGPELAPRSWLLRRGAFGVGLLRS